MSNPCSRLPWPGIFYIVIFFFPGFTQTDATSAIGPTILPCYWELENDHLHHPPLPPCRHQVPATLARSFLHSCTVSIESTISPRVNAEIWPTLHLRLVEPTRMKQNDVDTSSANSDAETDIRRVLSFSQLMWPGYRPWGALVVMDPASRVHEVLWMCLSMTGFSSA